MKTPHLLAGTFRCYSSVAGQLIEVKYTGDYFLVLSSVLEPDHCEWNLTADFGGTSRRFTAAYRFTAPRDGNGGLQAAECEALVKRRVETTISRQIG